MLSLPFTTIQIPVPNAVLMSRQGLRRNSWHHGIDLTVVVDDRASRGADIIPIAPGVVEKVCRWPDACCGGYGSTVLVKHDDDLYSFYAHMDRVDVDEGQEVDWTTVLGIVGDQFADFRADGCPRLSMVPHLHLEIRHADGSRYDVLQVLAAGGLRIDSSAMLARTEPFDYEEPRLEGSTEKSDGVPEVIVGNPALLLPHRRVRGIGWPVAIGFGVLGVLAGLWFAKKR